MKSSQVRNIRDLALNLEIGKRVLIVSNICPIFGTAVLNELVPNEWLMKFGNTNDLVKIVLSYVGNLLLLSPRKEMFLTLKIKNEPAQLKKTLL